MCKTMVFAVFLIQKFPDVTLSRPSVKLPLSCPTMTMGGGMACLVGGFVGILAGFDLLAVLFALAFDVPGSSVSMSLSGSNLLCTETFGVSSVGELLDMYLLKSMVRSGDRLSWASLAMMESVSMEVKDSIEPGISKFRGSLAGFLAGLSSLFSGSVLRGVFALLATYSDTKLSSVFFAILSLESLMIWMVLSKSLSFAVPALALLFLVALDRMVSLSPTGGSIGISLFFRGCLVDR